MGIQMAGTELAVLFRPEGRLMTSGVPCRSGMMCHVERHMLSTLTREPSEMARALRID